MYCISQSKANTLYVYAYSFRVTVTLLHQHFEGLLELLHVYMNSPGVTITNIIEGLLEHLHVYGNSPRVTVTLCIEELYLLSIKFQGC